MRARMGLIDAPIREMGARFYEMDAPIQLIRALECFMPGHAAILDFHFHRMDGAGSRGWSR